MAAISLRGVSKSFGGKKVADQITFDVADREFLVLLGPSGCGKSTLLRMLAGLEQVGSGEIHVGARRVDTLPPSARDMAFVFQSYALYPHMTVRRNITFPLIMRAHRWWFHLPLIGGLAKRRIEQTPAVRALVERTARTLALTEMLDQYPRTLSGGQRQRVALGRALVRQPEVFLMDEPLSNLDAKLRSSMRAEIIKLHREVGSTFVYVTHDQIEAMTMGTRIALMRDGVVQQFGTPRDIYTDPANSFVARFIGTPPMNLIEARIVPQRGLAIGPVLLPLPGHLAALEQPTARDVLLGIRPHALRPGRGKDLLAGQVVLVEHAGAESIVSIRLDHAHTAHHEDGTSAAEVMLVLQGYSDLCAGQPVQLSPDLGEAVVFDRAGQRIRVPAHDRRH
ncbi:ABC transporter ATP-binding protein [Verminephrobacter eiseniae]|uniref:ABC transporter ATP-binding protein n=1 Tax=Verminephrobacter eiseniae TaxID=364317 RepID=UPI002238AFE1|nr:ABC transporter ATP-binding protein [Verminephrobacter eiseniae]MCW5231306.1 ABC transporter ATP-binding protein [Verminephrobacter eiseniae]MCW5293038.1 ABC transporter ATP-binding protein [Verminephrobacter eiseniae]MCW8184431.1 ABC transporter ATP-binding protein [Verminephrobacter eiseniae]MCW8221445.1 ABC transporter ATP-binding protein [Verminephrobacter eiseniae]MCW8232384.1 ABC transporter ATP-binding protein [Verminephrobacter eiseniae]